MKLKDVDFTLQIKKPESSYRDLIEELENTIERLKWLDIRNISNFKGSIGEDVMIELKTK